MDLAAKILLRQRLDQLQAQEAGMRRQIDSECLHDFRVAVRHSRAVLKHIREIFPAKTARRFRDDFSWLNRVSGPARDRDVMLAKLQGYRDRLPAHLQDTLAPLQRHWEEERLRHYRELIATLDSPRYRQFIRAWRRFLDAPVPAHPEEDNAQRSAGDTAGPLIRRAHKKFLRRGDTLTEESSADDLHRLRKTCKRLRYLLDLFQPLLPKRSAKLGNKVKKLQDMLGDIHDLHVQTESLRQYLAGQETHSMIYP
jgi:CHAD domain-containing protein